MSDPGAVYYACFAAVTFVIAMPIALWQLPSPADFTDLTFAAAIVLFVAAAWPASWVIAFVTALFWLLKNAWRK